MKDYQIALQVIRRRLRELLTSTHRRATLRSTQGRPAFGSPPPSGCASPAFSTLHVRQATQAEPQQRAIYDALGVDPAPGGIKKMIGHCSDAHRLKAQNL